MLDELWVKARPGDTITIEGHGELHRYPVRTKTEELVYDGRTGWTVTGLTPRTIGIPDEPGVGDHGYIYAAVLLGNGGEVIVKRSPNGLWWGEMLDSSQPRPPWTWEQLLDHYGAHRHQTTVYRLNFDKEPMATNREADASEPEPFVIELPRMVTRRDAGARLLSESGASASFGGADVHVSARNNLTVSASGVYGLLEKLEEAGAGRVILVGSWASEQLDVFLDASTSLPVVKDN